MENLGAPLMKKFLGDKCAQDLVEWALMVGVVATGAGAILPGVSKNISQVFLGVDANIIRIVCAALVALFLGVIVLRRRETEEE